MVAELERVLVEYALELTNVCYKSLEYKDIRDSYNNDTLITMNDNENISICW